MRLPNRETLHAELRSAQLGRWRDKKVELERVTFCGRCARERTPPARMLACLLVSFANELDCKDIRPGKRDRERKAQGFEDAKRGARETAAAASLGRSTTSSLAWFGQIHHTPPHRGHAHTHTRAYIHGAPMTESCAKCLEVRQSNGLRSPGPSSPPLLLLLLRRCALHPSVKALVAESRRLAGLLRRKLPPTLLLSPVRLALQIFTMHFPASLFLLLAAHCAVLIQGAPACTSLARLDSEASRTC